MMRALYWLVAGLIGACTAHLAMILLIPSVAERDITSLLRKAGP